MPQQSFYRLAVTASILLQCTQFASAGPEDPLKILLQGYSTPALRTLVEEKGGTVTHDLHIINAVGALLTRKQLDDALESPLIIRYLDDLSISEQPDEEPAENGPQCLPRGALELDRTDTGVSWRLFKKDAQEASLRGLELSWPTRLGEATAVSLDGRNIKPDFILESGAGKLSASFGREQAPALAVVSELTLHFKTDTETDQPRNVPQREFDFIADFGDDCSATLIPGYDDNIGNSYFPTVVGADALHLHGVTGDGVTVAVLDSGLWEAPAIAHNTHGEPRISARFDAITNTTGGEAFDESGHGTHLTSALANSDPVIIGGHLTGSFKGIAPDVNLVAIKAFNEQGQGDFLDIVRGVQWAVDNRETYNIRILNLSFAASPRWHYWEDPINQAIMRAWASGIAVVAAAGNEGPDPMSVGSPGNLPYIITVGAITDSWTVDTRDDDYIPDFSSGGPTPSAHIKPDIVAPGGHIVGITRPGSTLTRDHPDYLLKGGELVMTGTSQAAAIVSGIAALLLQLDPELSPDDLKCKLTSSAELAINSDGLLAYTPFQQGNGYVSATRAVTLGQLGCANIDLDIEQDIAGKEHYQGPAIVKSGGGVSLPGLEEMVSAEAPAKGHSDIRKWGVKAHIERDPLPSTTKNKRESPFNWRQRYLEEQQLIKRLSTQPD